MKRSWLERFVAPAEASASEVRRAGTLSFVTGAVIVVVAFLLATFDARWTGGAILRTRARLLIVVAVMLGYLLGVQGLYRWITGVARGADESVTSTGGRMGRVAFILLAGSGLLVSIVAAFVVITPPEPPAPAPHGFDLAIPPEGTNEVRYNVGDATVTITRVRHEDGGVALDGPQHAE